jgi:flagellar assembly protein FliH
MSRDGRPRNVHFVDVSPREKDPPPPAWLMAREDDALVNPAEYPVSPLSTPEIASHARPALSPLLESLRPPPGGRSPSQFPPGMSRPPPPSMAPPGYPSQMPPPGRTPSQFPGAPSVPPPGYSAGGSQYPGANDVYTGEPGLSGALRERRRDTLVEDLVPRAEEEAVSAIKSAIESFANERARALADAEKELVELVKVICRRVVLREVSLSSSVVEALVREGLLALGKNDRMVVKLGPFFADALDHIRENLRHQGIDCSVVIDPGSDTYGCVIETELGRVDESVETRLNVLFANLDTVP